MKITLFCMLLCMQITKEKWRVSKVMGNEDDIRKKSAKEAEEINNEFNKDISYSVRKISFENFQKTISPVKKCCQNIKEIKIQSIDVGTEFCVEFEPRWDLVGGGHTWDLVVISHP